MNEVWAKSKWLRRCSSCIDSIKEGRKIECVGIEFEIIVVWVKHRDDEVKAKITAKLAEHLKPLW